ncbi:MAG TPA: hypothetical protein VI306_09145 [Pyrinomonadaceae bacterium]
MSDYINKLQKAIRDLHGCESQYLETVEVTETFQGKTIWQGDVEVFQIRGHPKAKRAFAWSHVDGANDQQTRFITVLELPPVTSPETAVKAAIMAEIQNAREKEKRR